MFKHVCSDLNIRQRVIGYIGEQIAQDYLRQLGFNAYASENSGRSSMIGDVFLRRRWYHKNGYCQGHWDTCRIEVKTTLSNRVQVQLSKREKEAHGKSKFRLPILAIRVLSLSSNKIDYEVQEVPSDWTSARKFEPWKGKPVYYEVGAPRKCHKFREHPLFSREELLRHEQQRYEKTIRFIRRALKNIGYFKVNPDLSQSTLNYVEAGVIRKEELV